MEVKIVFCPDCGAENKDNAKFCKNCGASLNKAANQDNTLKSKVADSDNAQKASQVSSNIPQNATKSSGNKNTLIICVTAIICVAINSLGIEQTVSHREVWIICKSYKTAP